MKLKLSRLSDRMFFIKCKDISQIDINHYNVVDLECEQIPEHVLYHFDSVYSEDPDVISIIRKYNFKHVHDDHYTRPFYFFSNTERPRLGNFISELIHILHHCEITNNSVYFPDTPGTFIINTIFRPFVGFTNDIFVDRKPREIDTVIDGKDFYYFPRYIPLEKERRRLCLKYVSTQLPKPLETEYDLVIHIRSGDIFQGNIHPDYIQPPFEYYDYVIRKHNYNNVLILSEPDFSNPVIQKLQDTFSFITVSSGSLENDMAIILGAKHLMIGTGSFAYMLSLCSSYLKQLYCFERHNVYYKDSDYNITVLGVDGNYPKFWNGDTQILTKGNWKIFEKDMTGFVERPKRLWSD
jgi:hypothetical protein